jgi:ArsR family transcriptional regulator
MVPDESIHAMAASFKALSDPVRLKILGELTNQHIRKDIGVCDLAKKLGLSQPNISHHLKVLKTAGFIKCRKQDTFCFYIINKDRIDEVRTALDGYLPSPADKGAAEQPGSHTP